MAATTLLVLQCNHKEDNATLTVEKFDRDSIRKYDTTLKKVDSALLKFEQQEAERLKNITSIKFDKEVYDFGACQEGEMVKILLDSNLLFSNNDLNPSQISCLPPTF